MSLDVAAQNRAGDDSPRSPLGSSPFDAPDPNDTTFVVDVGPGLDTGCSFRSEGPLIFNIEVTRFIGDKDKLLANGLIAKTALLRMPAFDVDFSGAPGLLPERDRVFFNGNIVPTEFLTGVNEVWKFNAFNIPIDWVNFPSAPGVAIKTQPTPAINTIRIDIDTANADGGEVWCTAIDWATLSIDVARPVLMVHGFGSGSHIWNTTWVPALDLLGLPGDTVDVGFADKMQDNANEIIAKVNTLRNRWGVDKINIVAHSKGGLYSRHYAETHDTVAVLAQMGTPNAGMPLANLIQAGVVKILGVPALIIERLAAPALYQLTTPYMDLYNLFHGHNPNTSYVSLAGDYRFGGLAGSLVDAILLGVHGGRNDVVVPVWSAHALGFMTHLTYPSTGTNTQAQHTSLHGSTDVYNQLAPFVTVRNPSLTSVQFSPVQSLASLGGQSNSGPTHTGTISGTIMQGQTMTHTLFMDGTLPIGFTLS